MLGTKTRACQTCQTSICMDMETSICCRMVFSAERFQTFWSIIQADSSHFCNWGIFGKKKKIRVDTTNYTEDSETQNCSEWMCCTILRLQLLSSDEQSWKPFRAAVQVVRGSLDDYRRRNLKSHMFDQPVSLFFCRGTVCIGRPSGEHAVAPNTLSEKLQFTSLHLHPLTVCLLVP